jgi:hypothetical protein
VIRKSLYKLLRWAQNYGCTASVELPVNNAINSRGMNFALYSASGGYVVEYRRFDENRGENITNLHIIKSDDDLGEKIGEIVTLELLRN